MRKGRRTGADVVAMGADGTPTEELDRLAETEILKVLDAEGVDWNLLSEEIGYVSRGGQNTLVVDPIDGTSNALRGLPFSTVSLALGRRDLASIEVGPGPGPSSRDDLLGRPGSGCVSRRTPDPHAALDAGAARSSS